MTRILNEITEATARLRRLLETQKPTPITPPDRMSQGAAGARRWPLDIALAANTALATRGALRGFLDRVDQGGTVLPGNGAGAPSHATRPARLPEGAQFVAASFTSHAGSRPYKLYVPSRYRPGEPTPLIVMLHGCTQSPDDFAAGTRMNDRAEERACLVVYPGQTISANVQRCWNWFSEDDQHRDRGEPALIAGITRQIMHDYSVDPRRVFVAGLSAGGATAAIMAEAYPDLFAAVGVHSGLPCGAAKDMASALTAMQRGSVELAAASDDPRPGTRPPIVPAIVFHGDRDNTVNPRNGAALVARSARAAALTASSAAGQVPNGHAFTRTLHTDKEGRTVIEDWVVHGAGHAWFGGSPEGSYTDSRGPDATKEMLRFFIDHPHPVRTRPA